MRSIYAVLILLLMLIASAHCQQTAEEWFTKGNALNSQGKYDIAIKAYDEAIRLDPKYAKAWNNKGIEFSHMGKYEDAIKCYDRALEVNPKYIPARNNKSSALKGMVSALQVEIMVSKAGADQSEAIYNIS
jgi:tetratricopeptide (TPR) repeat protein